MPSSAASPSPADLINGCIEHPVRGKALDSDDPKPRAIAAYILAQRKGKTLNYGQHQSGGLGARR